MATPSHGHALYLEGQNGDGQTLQFLIVGFGTSGPTVIEYRMFSRMVSVDTPQPRWRVEKDPQERKEIAQSVDGKLLRMRSEIDATEFAEKEYRYLSASIEAVFGFKWRVHKDPIFLQVSALDYLDLKTYTTPKKLIDRVNRCREERGFDALPKKKAATR